MKIQKLSLALLVGSVALLPGCWPFDSDEAAKPAAPTPSAGRAIDEEDVWVTVDGNVVLTVQDYEQYESQVLQAQPQVRNMMALVSPQERAAIMNELREGLKKQELILQWARVNGIDKRTDFQNDYRQALRMIERGLAMKYFQEDNPVNVSESDIKRFYDDNKGTLYLMAPAGIATIGVSFEKEAVAKAFYDKASAAGADFAAQAKDAQLPVRSLSNVSEQSTNIDESLKKAILSVNKFPTVKMVKGENDSWWVVQAKAKEEEKYFSLDQIKDDARNRLSAERMAQNINDTIAKLQEDHEIVQREEYFLQKAQEDEASGQGDE